jgi:hypothetical protein
MVMHGNAYTDLRRGFLHYTHQKDALPSRAIQVLPLSCPRLPLGRDHVFCASRFDHTVERFRRVERAGRLETDSCVGRSRMILLHHEEEYEERDAAFHQAISNATHNALLIEIARTIGRVRKRTDWGELMLHE